ncbi:MAG: hypothetical protein GY754_30910, partial [bacterium]|nr:hypothetical protein [bacterium]
MNILHKILNNVAMLFMVVIVGGSIISCDSIDRGTYEGDFAIRTQKDLKEIAGYSKITGSLGVQDDDGDCNFLEDCKIDLEDLDLLGNLTSIGGNLTIHDCPILENLDGLKNLTSIGGDLRIGSEYEMDFYYDTASLTNIKGLS